MADIVLLVFSGLVALSTLVYAVLTWRLVTETKRMREVQTEPKVSVRAELSRDVGHGGIELIIRNEGQGPAQNIRFEFEGNPMTGDKRPFGNHVLNKADPTMTDYVGYGYYPRA